MMLEQISKLVLYQDGRLIYSKTGRTCDNAIQRGYRKVSIAWKPKNLQARAHRVIWFMFHGAIPEGMLVDHINGDRSDNRIENLRLVDHADNSQNCTGKGYYLSKKTGRWQAYIYINYKSKHLGTYSTEDAARLAYLEAKLVYHKSALERIEPEVLELRAKLKVKEYNE